MKPLLPRDFTGVCLMALAFTLLAPAASAAKVDDFPRARIALVGGTFINDALLKSEGILKGSFTIKTKAGVSPTIWYGETGGVPFYYVHMHGEGRFVETWAALYELGVRDAIGGATAGGINPSMKLYDYVVPHDFIDMNITRPLAMPMEVYKDQGKIPIPRYVPAMDPLLQKILIEETRKAIRASRDYDDIGLHERGVLIQARGGRFETAAEVRMMGLWGADLVTMSIGTEMTYARMMGIHYAALVSISNPAEGVGDWDWETLRGVYPRINPLSLGIVLAAIPRIAAIGDEVPRVGDALRFHPEMTSGQAADEKK
jgi:5'-methylthioadenosine phosphorylase